MALVHYYENIKSLCFHVTILDKGPIQIYNTPPPPVDYIISLGYTMHTADAHYCYVHVTWLMSWEQPVTSQHVIVRPVFFNTIILHTSVFCLVEV